MKRRQRERLVIEEVDFGDWPEEKFRAHFPDLDPKEGCQFVDEIELPTKFEVCPRCKGKGTHVNPNIDGHGITSEEWENDWSDEEKDHYMRGDYDVPCYECGGERVVPVVDEEACKGSPVLEYALEVYEERERDRALMRAEEAAERRFGC